MPGQFMVRTVFPRVSGFAAAAGRLFVPLAWLGCAAACFADEPAGVGVALRAEGGRIFINKVLPDTPAAASGALHANDRVLAVAEGDGEAVRLDGVDLGRALRMLRGTKGTTVRLTVVPAGKPEAQARVVSIVRGELAQLWGDGKLLERGAEAPDVSLARLPGGERDALANYRGKVVVLAFWASWCGPCQGEMAELQTLLDRHPEWGGKVVVLAASIDESRDVVEKHLEKRGWNKTRNLWTDLKALRAYHVEAVPTAYVIDAAGKVAAANPNDLASAVNSALGRP